MNKTIIILNGPPGSGKDVIAAEIKKALKSQCVHLEFKDCLHDIAFAMTGLAPQQYFDIYNDRDLKERKLESFYGLSPRELLITISEDMVKPVFGKDFFGKYMVNKINKVFPDNIVFSDGGFPDEVNALAKEFGASNIKVVRLYRPGHTFEGDSRNYLDRRDLMKGVVIRDVNNTGTIKDATMKILNQFYELEVCETNNHTYYCPIVG